jgi:hypothetical protein
MTSKSGGKTVLSGPKQAGGMKAKVAKSARTKDSIRQKTLQAATTLDMVDPAAIKYTATQQSISGGGSDAQHLNPRAFHTGQWTTPSSRDTEMEMRRELQVRSAANGGATDFGVMSVDGSQVVNYLKEKKDQEQHLKSLRLIEQAIDPKNPATQDHVYAIYDELISVPRQHHLNQLAIQEGLREMLHHGRINGKQDNELILRILQPDFQLPVTPLWDADGQILAKVTDKVGRAAALQAGIFSPRQYGWSAAGVGNKVSLAIKRMILRRLYPGLREKSDDDIDLFINSIASDTMASADGGDYTRQGVRNDRYLENTVWRPVPQP